jgi:gamma-glutamylcyclotransferase (GGCT)/AIG2-like uncharacterized protein YtfP
MRLFLYGTLLDPDLLARFARHPAALVPATLRGWRRVALPVGRYPTLCRARGQVEGALSTVDGRTFARLAAYEGPAYRLTRVSVRTAKGNTTAQAWIAPGGTHRAWPRGSNITWGNSLIFKLIDRCNDTRSQLPLGTDVSTVREVGREGPRSVRYGVAIGDCGINNRETS